MLAGRMMDFPLTLTHLLERARTLFGGTEIVSRRTDRSLHRTTYGELYRRTSRLANALARLGAKPGDRVATLAWNHSRHLELYFGAPCSGAVLHTLNLRLHPSEIGYIANHAEDRFLFVDRSLLPLWQAVSQTARTIEKVIVLDDGEHEGPSAPPLPGNAIDYESLLAAESDAYTFPALEERSAAMICYTSGTTGNPKGVVYSHRSVTLHSLAICMTDTLGLSENDAALPVVPMFHANAWGLPYGAALSGSKLVFPGCHLDAVSILDLMSGEKVTLAGGVPTIWLGILALLDNEPKRWDLSAMRTMVIGGSAAPPSLIDGFKKRHGLEVTHAWGMTEMNPIGTLARVKRHLQTGDDAELSLRGSQGYAVPFVETRHVGEDGRLLPRDGETMGELEVRGPWVAASYLGDEGDGKFTADGWFKTGDVVTIDAEGYLRITDRSKDVIKSGGEWISSVQIENALMSHPAVLEAAVFAARHPRWDERPVAAVVFKEGQSATGDELTAHIAGRFAKFWLPDDYVVMKQIPRTSTGKFLKTKLRDEYGDLLLKKGS
jgi:fatty-acyl-CoA synthase